MAKSITRFSIFAWIVIIIISNLVKSLFKIFLFRLFFYFFTIVLFIKIIFSVLIKVLFTLIKLISLLFRSKFFILKLVFPLPIFLLWSLLSKLLFLSHIAHIQLIFIRVKPIHLSFNYSILKYNYWSANYSISAGCLFLKLVWITERCSRYFLMNSSSYLKF